MPGSDPVRRILAEIKRRRVLEVVAIYAGLSFAVLEGADVVIGALRLSPDILTGLTVFVLLGFPVALTVGWMYDLDVKGRIRRTHAIGRTGGQDDSGDGAPGDEAAAATRRGTSWQARGVMMLSLLVLVTASWLIASRVTRMEVAGAMEDPRGSYLVVPFHTRAHSAEDRSTSMRAARNLTRQLNGWDSVRVVQSMAVDGLMVRLGLNENDALSLERAFEMAELLRAGTLIGLGVEGRGDSLDLEAVMYDVAGRREIGQPIVLTGPADDVGRLVAPIAQDVLELRDQSVGMDDLRSESANPMAHRSFEDGLDALHDWRLDDAESHFREALEADAEFASAHHYLAITLFWQMSRGGSRSIEVGPEISRSTQVANRLAVSGHLRPGLRPHLEAFGAFWRGDYETARQAYRSIVEKDPTDTEGWLLLGAVEYQDPALRQFGTDSLVPRRNLNVARRAFETAAELSPDWQISYGNLFEMDRMLASAALNIRCLAFERPGAPRRPPIEVGDPANIYPRSFCPIVDDSIIWVGSRELEERQASAIENIERLAAGSRRLLETWTSIHPDQARPHEELAEWLAWRRATLGCKADPSELHQLTSAILAERSTSLLLRGDTTREDLLRLSMLQLALDSVEVARDFLDRAMADVEPGTPVPPGAGNVYLALGLPGVALEVMEPLWSTLRLASRDPESGATLSLGNISRPVTVLKMYGATSLEAGPEIRDAFDELEREWSGLGYTPRQMARIRSAATAQDIGPALALLDRSELERWFDGWEEVGLEVPALWRAFMSGGAAVDEWLAELEQERITTLDQHYLSALLTRDAGRIEETIDQLRTTGACPLVLDAPSGRWGLRTLAHWHLAQSYFATGDSIRGREALSRYTALRADRGPIGD